MFRDIFYKKWWLWSICQAIKAVINTLIGPKFEKIKKNHDFFIVMGSVLSNSMILNSLSSS